MKCKTLEIRDEGTFISVLAIQTFPCNYVQRYYLRRVGYPPDGTSIIVMILNDCKATNDPYEWTYLGYGPRTLPVAHNYIIENFDSLQDGDVIDVQFILKETPTKKISEREGGPIA